MNDLPCEHCSVIRWLIRVVDCEHALKAVIAASENGEDLAPAIDQCRRALIESKKMKEFQ